MKGSAPVLLLVAGLCCTVFTIVSGGSYSRLQTQRESLVQQKELNTTLERNVKKLRKQVYDLKHSDRALEKTARQELGMVRENELMVVFEESVAEEGASGTASESGE